MTRFAMAMVSGRWANGDPGRLQITYRIVYLPFSLDVQEEDSGLFVHGQCWLYHLARHICQVIKLSRGQSGAIP
jgi:hypothetical protein